MCTFYNIYIQIFLHILYIIHTQYYIVIVYVQANLLDHKVSLE